MKSKFEIFLDTDIFIDHISRKNSNEVSLLQKCKSIFNGCYTSVINASEIFSGISGNKLTEKTKKTFDGIGILGIPFRYSLKIGNVMNVVKKKNTGNTLRDVLVIAICSETKLPLLTSNMLRYKDISKIFKVKLIKKETIINNNSPELIFKKAKIL